MIFPFAQQKHEELGGGVSRCILAHAEPLMLVEVYFDKGAIGSVHSHPHEQIAWVKEGRFEFEIDGKKQILQTGDSVFLPGDQPHGAVCLEAGPSGKGILHDIFTPEREDFLPKGSSDSPDSSDSQ